MGSVINKTEQCLKLVVLNYIGLKSLLNFFVEKRKTSRVPDVFDCEAKLCQRLRNNVSAGFEADCCSA